MQSHRSIAVRAVFAVAVLATAACGSSTSSGQSASTAGSSSVQPTTSSSAASAGSSDAGSQSTATGSSAGQAGSGKDVKSLKIGFAQRTADAPYYVAMQKQAEQLATAQGFSLLFQSAGSDPVVQIDQVNTMISQGVDVLIVNAVSAGTEKQQMTQAATKKPLLFIDTSIAGVGFTAVSSDNATIGKDSGALMAKRIGSGKSVKVAILNGGPTDVDVGPARRNGFLAGLKEGGVTADIVAEAEADYSQDKAVQATENMLTAHPDINVIFGYNDAMALGALSVLKRQKNTTALISSVDGQKEALAAIKDGGCSGQYVSTGLNSPSLAAKAAVQAAIDIGTGAKKTSDFPKVSFTEAAGINCDNVAKFYDPNSTF